MTRERPPTYAPLTLDAGIWAVARWSPRSVALRDGDDRLTYGGLVDRSHRVANALSAGAGPDARAHAGLLSPNCLRYMEIVLGGAAAGVPAVLLNPRSSVSELEFMAADADLRVLFVHPSLEEPARAASLPSDCQIVVMDDEYERWLGRASSRWNVRAADEWDTFCLLYTSGSTGVPKAVQMPHRQRVLQALVMASEMRCYSPTDCALGMSPLYHGGGLGATLATLLFGGTSILMPRFDAGRALRLIADHGITSVWGVPTHFGDMLDACHGSSSTQTRSLAAVVSNAAPLPAEMKERLAAAWGDHVLFDAYGSTEAGLVSLLRPDDQRTRPTSVGRPVLGVQTRLVDDDGAAVPERGAGELSIRSPYLFNGYWRRPDEDARVLNDGWLSTGDIARLDEDGYLYLLDRRGEAIVSGGVTIFPREIEAVLETHPEVVEVSVFGLPDSRWGEAVHAVVATVGPQARDANALQEYVRARSAAYKVPKSIEFVDRLPRNATGKIDRRRLREDRAGAQVT